MDSQCLEIGQNRANSLALQGEGQGEGAGLVAHSTSPATDTPVHIIL